jgi:hypothetical protein
MKIGLGLYRHMLTRDYCDFARQVGCTHFVVHLVDYFKQGPCNPRYNQPTGSKYEPWGLAGDAGWTHYSVVAAVRFLSAAAAPVMERRSIQLKTRFAHPGCSPWALRGTASRSITFA